MKTPVLVAIGVSALALVAAAQKPDAAKPAPAETKPAAQQPIDRKQAAQKQDTQQLKALGYSSPNAQKGAAPVAAPVLFPDLQQNGLLRPAAVEEHGGDVGTIAAEGQLDQDFSAVFVAGVPGKGDDRHFRVRGLEQISGRHAKRTIVDHGAGVAERPAGGNLLPR